MQGLSLINCGDRSNYSHMEGILQEVGPEASDSTGLARIFSRSSGKSPPYVMFLHHLLALSCLSLFQSAMQTLTRRGCRAAGEIQRKPLLDVPENISCSSGPVGSLAFLHRFFSLLFLSDQKLV